MKTAIRIATMFSVLVVAMTVGCATVDDLSTSHNEKVFARVRINSAGGNWNISTRTTVDRVDDEYANSGKTYVAIDPGEHVLQLSFHKEISPGLGAMRFTLNIGGSETVLHEPEPTQVIYSIVPKRMKVYLSAGKTYRLSSTDDLRRASPDPSRPWAPSGVDGSWECYLEEE
jgi:hypothetical protein